MAQDPIRLDGDVVRPPIVLGRRLLVTTNLGAIYLFEIDKAATANPVSELTKLVATYDAPVTPYVIEDRGQVWIGDSRLTRYQLQASRGQIVRKAVTHEGDAFVGPLTTHGNFLFTLRRQADETILSALRIDRPDSRDHDADPIWEVGLDVRPAGEPISSGNGRMVLVTAQAELFEIGPEQLERGHDDQAKKKPPDLRALRLNQSVDVGDGRVLFLSDAERERVAVYDSTDSRKPWQLLELRVDPASLTNMPVLFGGNLLATSGLGQILVLDLLNGQQRPNPFQPKLYPGQRVAWRTPAVLEDATPQAVVWDGKGKMYRLALDDADATQLSMKAQRDIEWELTDLLSAVGDTVYGVRRTVEKDQVVAFNVSDLAPGEKWDVEGRVSWGPARVGEAVFVATDASDLHCFQTKQQRKWTVTIPHGAIVGRPLELDTTFVFACQDGMLWRIAADTGEEVGQFNIGEPLGTGPVKYDANTLLVAGHDATMYVVATP